MNRSADDDSQMQTMMRSNVLWNNPNNATNNKQDLLTSESFFDSVSSGFDRFFMESSSNLMEDENTTSTQRKNNNNNNNTTFETIVSIKALGQEDSSIDFDYDDFSLWQINGGGRLSKTQAANEQQQVNKRTTLRTTSNYKMTPNTSPKKKMATEDIVFDSLIMKSKDANESRQKNNSSPRRVHRQRTIDISPNTCPKTNKSEDIINIDSLILKSNDMESNTVRRSVRRSQSNDMMESNVTHRRSQSKIRNSATSRRKSVVDDNVKMSLTKLNNSVLECYDDLIIQSKIRNNATTRHQRSFVMDDNGRLSLKKQQQPNNNVAIEYDDPTQSKIMRNSATSRRKSALVMDDNFQTTNNEALLLLPSNDNIESNNVIVHRRSQSKIRRSTSRLRMSLPTKLTNVVTKNECCSDDECVVGMKNNIHNRKSIIVPLSTKSLSDHVDDTKTSVQTIEKTSSRSVGDEPNNNKPTERFLITPKRNKKQPTKIRCTNDKPHESSSNKSTKEEKISNESSLASFIKKDDYK